MKPIPYIPLGALLPVSSWATIGLCLSRVRFAPIFFGELRLGKTDESMLDCCLLQLSLLHLSTGMSQGECQVLFTTLFLLSASRRAHLVLILQ